jgi:hypothetical protein
MGPPTKPTTKWRPRHPKDRKVGSKSAPANRIEHHVQRPFAARRLQPRTPVILGRIDGFVGAQSLAEGPLLFARCGGDDPRAHELGDLHGPGANAAGRAADQHGFSLRQRRPIP